MTSLTYAIHPPFPQSEVEATLQRINGHKVRRNKSTGISRIVPKNGASLGRLSSSDAAFSKKKPPLLPRLFFYASLSREPRRFSLRRKLTQTF